MEREYHERFSGAIERWLDAGYGSCVLRRHECAAVVAEALRHFDGDRVSQIAWVVMPNHVHAVFVLNPAWSLEKIILSWKGFTARKINPLLGRKGNFWQRDYFDRLVRDTKHLATVFVTSDGMRKRGVCAKASLFCTRTSSPEALSETALWKDAAPLIYNNSASNSVRRLSNKRSVLSMGTGVVISTPAAINVSSGNWEPPERKNFRYASTVPG